MFKLITKKTKKIFRLSSYIRLLKKIANPLFYIKYYFKTKVSFLLTLFFNFYFLPFRQAIYFPIWIYKGTKLLSFEGTFTIDCSKLITGMIRIGKNNESPCPSGGGTEIINKSEIIFKGVANIGCGCRLITYGKGKIIIGKKVNINNQNVLGSANFIEIGDSVNIASQVYINDTDYHFLYNYASNSIRINSKSIHIGNYSWIGNRVSIMKGTKIPENTIVGSSSLLNKEYDINENTILAGIPAKQIAHGYARIRNKEIEANLYNYFCSEKEDFKFGCNVNIDELIEEN